MNTHTPYSLVLQGGGFRTAFTAGVLDAFIAQDFDPFDQLVGVSGGAIILSYYLSKQYGSAFEAMCILATDPHFMKFARTMSKEGYMDIDYLRLISSERVPFDIESALQSIKNRRCHFVATDRRHGNPVYLEPNKKDWVDDVIASSTLPFFTKGVHEMNDQPYFDGGWSDPLPAQWSYDEGARRMLVIQTSPTAEHSKQSWADYFGSIYFRNDANLSRCFAESHLRYNESIDFIQEPPVDLDLAVIAPPNSLRSGTFSHTIETLTEDYRSGLDHGLRFVMKLRETE